MTQVPGNIVDGTENSRKSLTSDHPIPNAFGGAALLFSTCSVRGIDGVSTLQRSAHV